MILLFASGGITNVTISFAKLYVAGFAIRPFIESINCDVAAVFPILVSRSIPSTLNLNESLVPSTKHLKECPTPCPCDVRSIALPLRVADSSIVLASTYLT